MEIFIQKYLLKYLVCARGTNCDVGCTTVSKLDAIPSLPRFVSIVGDKTGNFRLHIKNSLTTHFSVGKITRTGSKKVSNYYQASFP